MKTQAIAIATFFFLALLSLACQSEGPRVGYLLALDAATGDELWRVETGITLMAAPVVSGDTVSVEGGDCGSSPIATHTFSAASGDRISTAVDPSKLGACSRMPPELLTTSMQFSRVSGSGDLVATDRTTGQERWQMELPKPSSGASDLSLTAGADILVVSYLSRHFPEESGTKITIVLDANSGAEFWRVAEEEAIGLGPDQLPNISTDERTVYIMYTGLYARDGSGDRPEGRIEAFEADTGAMRWQTTSAAFTANAHISSGEGRLLVANDSLAVMLDYANGDMVWEKPIQPPSASTEGAIANGVAYLALSAAPYGGRRD